MYPYCLNLKATLKYIKFCRDVRSSFKIMHSKTMRLVEHKTNKITVVH